MKMKQDWKDRWASFENWKREGMNSLWVATGLVGSMFLDRGLQKLVDKLPESMIPYAGGLKALGQAAVGLMISTAVDPKDAASDKFRLMGYGITGSGIVSGLRLIPQIDQFLSGSVSGLSGADRLLGLSLGNFGSVENVKQIATADAEGVDLDLPDLGNSRLPMQNMRVLPTRTVMQPQVKPQVQPQTQQQQTQSQQPQQSVRYQPRYQWQTEDAGQSDESEYSEVDFSQIL